MPSAAPLAWRFAGCSSAAGQQLMGSGAGRFAALAMPIPAVSALLESGPSSILHVQKRITAVTI
jgi:hypothetical protein